jgi:hypothetical protein
MMSSPKHAAAFMSSTACRWPDIMQQIRKMAEARVLANEPTRRQGRKRKASTTS